MAAFSGGLKAFNKVDCGGPGGTCPFVDESNTYTQEGHVSKSTSFTPAPLKDSGCALSDSSLCRFGASSTGNVLTARLNLEEDWVNNGRRNELAVLREDCNTKYHPAENEDRYYSFTVTLPSNIPSAMEVIGPGNHLLFQIHEESNCVSGGPYFGFYLRRTDSSKPDDSHGSGWHLTFHERETFTETSKPVRMWPDRNQLQTVDTVGSGGSTHRVVVHKKWSKYGSAAGSNYADPPFGANEVWLDGVRVYAHLNPTLFERTSTQAMTCDVGKSAGVVDLTHKTGVYVESNPDNQTNVPFYQLDVQVSDVAVGADCQSVWNMGGTVCPR